MMHPMAAILSIVLALAGIGLLFHASGQDVAKEARTPAMVGGVTCVVLAAGLVAYTMHNNRKG